MYQPLDHIRAEEPGDSLAIDEVVRRAFEREDEVQLVQDLRNGGLNLLSLVATFAGRAAGPIVGHVLFTRLKIIGEQQTWPAVALAPLAVLPDYQRHQIGTALVKEGLQQLIKRGEQIVVLLGHEHYYTRFGFRADLAIPLQSPFSGPSWMALELQPGALTGVCGRVSYAPPFGIS